MPASPARLGGGCMPPRVWLARAAAAVHGDRRHQQPASLGPAHWQLTSLNPNPTAVKPSRLRARPSRASHSSACQRGAGQRGSLSLWRPPTWAGRQKSRFVWTRETIYRAKPERRSSGGPCGEAVTSNPPLGSCFSSWKPFSRSSSRVSLYSSRATGALPPWLARLGSTNQRYLLGSMARAAARTKPCKQLASDGGAVGCARPGVPATGGPARRLGCPPPAVLLLLLLLLGLGEWQLP